MAMPVAELAKSWQFRLRGLWFKPVAWQEKVTAAGDRTQLLHRVIAYRRKFREYPDS